VFDWTSTTQHKGPGEDLKIIMTLDNSFASDEDIMEDYPETALAHITASPSHDETDIDYDSTSEQLHNLVLLWHQHAQQTTEQTVNNRLRWGRGGHGTLARDTVTDGTLASDTVTDDTVQEGQAAKFPPNSDDHLVEQRLLHVGYRRLRGLKPESDY
jgi:hypothetical protein